MTDSPRSIVHRVQVWEALKWFSAILKGHRYPYDVVRLTTGASPDWEGDFLDMEVATRWGLVARVRLPGIEGPKGRTSQGMWRSAVLLSDLRSRIKKEGRAAITLAPTENGVLFEYSKMSSIRDERAVSQAIFSALELAPNIPTLGEDCRGAFRRVSGFMCEDESRTNLQGVHVSRTIMGNIFIPSRGARLVATDGHTLSSDELPFDIGAGFISDGFVKAVTECRTPLGVTATGTDDTRKRVSAVARSFTAGAEYTLIDPGHADRDEGEEFPDWSYIIPGPDEPAFSVEKKEFAWLKPRLKEYKGFNPAVQLRLDGSDPSKLQCLLLGFVKGKEQPPESFATFVTIERGRGRWTNDPVLVDPELLLRSLYPEKSYLRCAGAVSPITLENEDSGLRLLMPRR